MSHSDDDSEMIGRYKESLKPITYPDPEDFDLQIGTGGVSKEELERQLKEISPKAWELVQLAIQEKWDMPRLLKLLEGIRDRRN